MEPLKPLDLTATESQPSSLSSPNNTNPKPKQTKDSKETSELLQKATDGCPPESPFLPQKQQLQSQMPASTSTSELTKSLLASQATPSNSKISEKINPFVSQFELERDRSLIKLLESFYQRYTMLFFSDSEKEKAEKLVVKVKFADETFGRFTRNSLDEFVSCYRLMYKSFCNIKTYIGPKEAEKFDKHYSVEQVFKLNSKIDKKIAIRKNPLRAVWQTREEQEQVCYHSLRYLTTELFPAENRKLISEKVFGNDATEITVLDLLVQKHIEFVCFMARLNIVLNKIALDGPPTLAPGK